ncbi:MAG: DinB family protein [Bacteroidota bacterium]
MKQIPWFERKFDFASKQNFFPAIIERLEGAPIRLAYKLQHIPEEVRTKRFQDKWSIQENVGHLLDLEPLWQGRLQDILQWKTFLRDADLSNLLTHQADHNHISYKKLLADFAKARRRTVQLLSSLDEGQIFMHALHPRLKVPMRTMDLFLFVAEHDDHHMARMTEIQRELSRVG